ncbi:MAG: hypothetical protein WC989_06765 [Micavibrio sp.]
MSVEQEGASKAVPTQEQLLHSALSHVRKILKGNGIKTDSVQIASHTIAAHRLNAGTYLELRPAIQESEAPGKSIIGRPVASREEAVQLADGAMRKAAQDSTMKARIADALLRRPDQGFGLQQAVIPLEFIKEDYSWHVGCGTCGGGGQTACPKCGGRKTEACTKCSGRGLMPCPLCRATGLLHGQKCTRCYGHRYVPCDTCHRAGMMACRNCNAHGTVRCATCGGQGWKTHLLSLRAQAVTYFEYDPKSIPKGAADYIETRAAYAATSGRVKLRGRIADDKENALGASYEVEFPYGEITFRLGRKEVKAHLFGYKADITEFPHILDKILAGPIGALERAAGDRGSVAAAIRKATRFRMIALAFLATGKGGPDKAAAWLLKQYDLGLGAATAEKISSLAHITMGRITKKPRLHGLAAGLAVTTLLMALYYFTPARAMLGASLPDPRLDILLDIVPPVLGGMICTAMIRMQAKRAVRNALGHLSKSSNGAVDLKADPDIGQFGKMGHLYALLLLPLIMEILYQTGGGAAFWYQWLRGVALGAL